MQNIYLSPYALKPSFCRGRIYKEPEYKTRTPFQRDRDRIIHSSAFRRLKHKTQVFVNTEKDHYRTRLTHSMEVSQIARTLARSLNLNEDICETLSLAHDLGHTPFGHAGEDALNECMTNYGGFDHNLQTLRIVMFLENKYFKFNGLNLTIETLDGLLKHNGPIGSFEKIKKILGIHIFKKKINFELYGSLESQISAISDDIAYNNHDLEDGLRANLFKLEELKDLPLYSELLKKHIKNKRFYRREIIINQIIREAINTMVNDIILNFKKNIKKQKIFKLKDVYRSKSLIVDFSNKMKNVDKETKSFLNKKMYNNKLVLNKTSKGKFIIQKLFKECIKKPKKYLRKDLLNAFSKERVVSDFISGMTDRYAISLYNNLK